MGLLTTLLGAPVLGPVKGARWIVGKVYDAAYDEFYDPASIKRQLLALEAQLDAGEITEDQFEAVELELLQRLKEAKQMQARHG
ncbi:MAG: gas vesicle protein GvpG [Pseudomonadota bacterium]